MSIKWPFSWPKKYVIGRSGEPYLTRWDILGTRHTTLPHIYLHQFHRSDSDIALHDHPFAFVTFILRSGYYERTESGTKWVKPFSILYRPLSWVHRIVLKKGTEGKVWTLVFTGPKRKEWGFFCPKGWKHWTEVEEKGCE